jgi:hypothetical protein
MELTRTATDTVGIKLYNVDAASASYAVPFIKIYIVVDVIYLLEL